MQEKVRVEMDIFIKKIKRKRRLNRREPRMVKTYRTSKFKLLKISREVWRNAL